MGDHEGWPQPNGLFPNGLLPNVAPSVIRDLDKERWSKAEERTAELIACIQPNQPSEERRNAVADYVQRLIMKCFDCQVFTFGSVPLKTYLPDGDIDLTAFSKNQKLKDSWANDVRDMLENEEKNENAEFHVKEVQYIQAEVKIIKCLVENIVVDISFNQLGGLCTLCFLEEVDHLIEQNHLFKRSIILIKAWCYYESRILGAHHGLISTYALETLVLYIFHVFNSSFAGPLEVLYRFLEFFSNFDWENFCVSLWGPVPISQLPDITAESPRKDGGELLLSKPFLDACSSVYSVYPVAPETQGQPFVSKHFNVVDPLRTNNNLGRSVSKGNFYRIRSAFAFGAKKLARLLECPKENIVAEVNQFFMNTWERHGSRYRPDVPSSDLWRLRPVDPEAVGVAGKQTTSSSTKKEESEKFAGKKHIPLHEGDVRLHNTSDIVLRNSNTVPCSVNRKAYGSQTNQNTSNSESAHNDHEHHPGYQFARAQSSPDLTASSGEASWRGKKSSKTSDSGKSHYATVRSDSGRKRNLASGSFAHQGLHASNSDPLSLRHSSPEPSLDVGGVSSFPTGSSSYDHDDVGEPHQDLQQEDHDLINMIATARAHGYLGAINLRSSQMPVPLSSVVGYPQRHMAGINFPMIDSTWGTGVTSNLVSSQLSHYFNGLGLAPNQEDLVQPANDASGVTESNQDDSNDPGFLEDSDAASPHSLEYASSSRPSSSSNTSTRAQHYRYQNSGAKNTYTSDTSVKSRYSPANEVNISKVSKPARDKRGRRTTAGGVVSNVYEKPKEGWPYEVDVPVLPDEVLNREWQNVSSRNSVSAPLGSGRMPLSYEASPSGSEPVIPVGPMLVGSGSRQIAFYPTGPPVPFVTMLPFNMYPPDRGNSDGSPRQFDREDGMLENGRASISDRSPALSGFEPLKNVEQPPIFCSPSTVDISPAQPRVGFGADILNSDFISHWQNLQYGRLCQNPHDPSLIYPPQIGPPVYLQGHFPWDGPGRPLSAANMGVFTQIMGYGPRFVPVSPMQQGSSRSSGVYQRYGEEVPRFRSGTGTYLPSPNPVPHRDRQSANRGQRGNYSHDGNEHEDNDRNWNSGPKQRNPARGQSKYDNRGQADKLAARLDRSASADGRRDRSWDSHRNEYLPPFSSQNLPFGPSNTIRNPGNVAYNMYSLEAVNASNAASSMGGAGQPMRSVVMLYPYDQNLACAPSHEQLEFGSMGPVHLGSVTDGTQVGDGCISPGSYEQRHNMFKGTSPTRLSPDQPSSPRMRRSLVSRNYQLKEEDFPPLAFASNRRSGNGNSSSRTASHYRTLLYARVRP